MWNCSIIETPPDGSCFFTAISIALNDPLSSWQECQSLRVLLEKHWNDYNTESGETPQEITPDMVRFMCSSYLDEDSLEMYNAEAQFRKDTEKEKNVKIFKNLTSMKEYVRTTNCWADHGIIRAFLKSMEYKCCVLIFDSDVGGMTHLPEEWTKEKDTYICLRRDKSHYNVIRLIQETEDGESKEMPICIDRTVVIDLAKTVNSSVENGITNVF